MKRLAEVALPAQVRLTLFYDDPIPHLHSWGGGGRFLLEGRMDVGGKEYHCCVETPPQMFGTLFFRNVEHVVIELTLQALADPAAQALMDQYTDLVQTGQFRPPV